jgi:hypothetical protein
MGWTRDMVDRARFHHTTQDSAQFKTHQLFISRTFHLIFLDPKILKLKAQNMKPQIRGTAVLVCDR